MQNRGHITPQPQSVVSYLNPDTPSPPAPPFPPPVGSTLQALFVAAGARSVAYFPIGNPANPQTLTTATIVAVT